MGHFTKKQYQQYLISPEWEQKRQERLRIDGYRCRGCGRPNTAQNPLQCHHINYYRFGEENVYTDLVSLCESCHKGIHRILCRPTGYDESGNIRYGWKSTVPAFIADDLKERGLMP